MTTITARTAPRLALTSGPGLAAFWATVLAALLATLLAASPAVAQSAPPTAAPGVGASGPLAPAKPGPKLLSPAETRDSASMPGEFRPEQAAKPQINIPLGNTPPAAASSPALRPQPGSKAGINDAVARCEAMVDEAQRARCRAGLAKQAPSR